MSAKDRQNPDDLLKHLPEYGVVVCRPCSFAIQPQALASHLLRHKIYRAERRQLLNRLLQLGLREPEDVPIPSPNAPPVAHLPVHQGFVCLKPECGHTCISQKRMHQHWSESHGESDSKNVQARRGALQTFFRGNKIRYFEVNSNAEAPTPSSSSAPSPGGDETPRFQELASIPSSSIVETDPSPEPQLPALDMQVLRYYHHYMSSPYLIPHRGERESQQFWTDTVCEEAFKHEFLMYGILGMSSTHLAAIAGDTESCQTHRGAAMKYQSAGMAAFTTAMKNPDTTNSVALIAYARLIGIQRLVLQQIEDNHNLPASSERHRGLAYITEFAFLLRGSQEVLLGLQHLLPHGADFILSEEDLDDLRPFDDLRAQESDMMRAFNVPTGLFNRIYALPQRLSEVGALQDDNELQAITQATAALLASTSRSYASGGIASKWAGLTTWLQSTEYLVRMLEAHREPALVVFAHWVPLLLRLEEHYVILQGQSSRLLKIIRENLSPALVELTTDLDPII